VILCLCRDVTAGDVARAVAEGYSDLETLKRFTGAFTGPCQGKACVDGVRRLFGELSGLPLEDVPEPVERPPVWPVRSDRRVGGVGRARRVACDLVCVAVGARPADELARQALETGRFSLAAPGAGGAASGGYRTPAGPGGARLFLTGGACGVWSAAEAIAGAAAAASASGSPGAS